MVDATLRREISRLVDDLAAGRFELLERDGRAGRLYAKGLVQAIGQYGKTLISLPEDAWKLLDVFPQQRAGELLIDVALWTKEEGRSDLTLSLSATMHEGSYRLEIDDLHVM